MNPSQSLYKSDFVTYDWMENNLTPGTEGFCSPHNVEECIQYISEEFGALGYPSIYQESFCPSSVPCDIVTLLNVTFELIGCIKDHAQVKDDLECRIQRMSSDLCVQNRKNTQLKDNLEALERKYRSVLERERQLKEKNDKLSQLLKNEKEENKKLSTQLQKQKITYEHEVRKHEKSIKQLKTRLKQVLTDKNSEKKVANVSCSSLLQRNSKERGKWVSGTAVKSNMEEMYNSVIASYENRNQEVLKELTDCQNCLVYVQDEMQDLVGFIKGEKENVPPLHVIWNGSNRPKELKESFNNLLSVIKESVKEKFCEDESSCQIISESTSQTSSALNSYPESQQQILECKKKKLEEKGKELSIISSLIEKEKASLESQRLEIIKMAMQQDRANSEFFENPKAPSLAVVTTKDDLIFLPTSSELKQSLNDPTQVKSPTPLWNMTFSKDREESSSKENSLPNSTTYEPMPSIPKEVQDIDFSTSDLPKWACLNSDSSGPNCQIELNETASNEDLDASVLNEEQCLAQLKAAFEDLELRRKNYPMQ